MRRFQIDIPLHELDKIHADEGTAVGVLLANIRLNAQKEREMVERLYGLIYDVEPKHGFGQFTILPSGAMHQTMKGMFGMTLSVYFKKDNWGNINVTGEIVYNGKETVITTITAGSNIDVTQYHIIIDACMRPYHYIVEAMQAVEWFSRLNSPKGKDSDYSYRVVHSATFDIHWPKEVLQCAVFNENIRGLILEIANRFPTLDVYFTSATEETQNPIIMTVCLKEN